MLVAVFACAETAVAQATRRVIKTLPTESYVEIRPGEDIQTAITANANGTVFFVRAAIGASSSSPTTYRLTSSLVPKTGNQFIAERSFSGERLVRISGARVLTGWIADGGRWYVTGQTQAGDTGAGIGDCAESFPGSGVIIRPRCMHPEDLFFDGTQQKFHEDALGDVGVGEYFFDYAADRIYVGDDPAGHTVETSLVPALFGTTSNVDNVVLRGFIIEKFASPTTSAAVNLCDGPNGSEHWIAEDNEIRYNHGSGVGFAPFVGCRARRNDIHHNCSYAVVGSGEGIVVDRNIIRHNNLWSHYTPAANTAVDETQVCGANDYNGAVFKLVFTVNAIARKNHAYQNKGIGIWYDIQNTGTLIEENRSDWNHMNGIFFEISCNAIIRRNYTSNNGTGQDFAGYVIGAGIEISTSNNVEVYENVLEDNWQQIAALHDDRRGPTGFMLCPTYGLRDLYVHNNHITTTVTGSGGYRTGVIDNPNTTCPGPCQVVEAFDAGFNNRFENNTYSLTGSPSQHYFMWNNVDVSDAAWVGVGHDDTGTIER